MDSQLKRLEKKQTKINWTEYPSGLLEYAPNEEDSYIDIIRAGEELRDCLFMAMRKHLNDIEQFTINHTFGLPFRGGECSRRYAVLNRKQQTHQLQELGIKTTAIKLKQIRLKAMAKIFKEIGRLI